MYKKLLLTFCLLLSTELMAQKLALIVGVADYTKSKDDLPGIEKDLSRIYTLFHTWGFKVKPLRGAETLNGSSCRIITWVLSYVAGASSTTVTGLVLD